MPPKYKSVNFKFDYAMFRNDIVATVTALEITFENLDVLSGVGTGNCSNIVNQRTTNHQLDTWLKIANAMDIDVRTYFVLED